MSKSYTHTFRDAARTAFAADSTLAAITFWAIDAHGDPEALCTLHRPIAIASLRVNQCPAVLKHPKGTGPDERCTRAVGHEHLIDELFQAHVTRHGHEF